MGMRFFDFYRSRTKSANTAKERLQGIVAMERFQNRGHEYLPRMRQELLQVIGKYMDVEREDVRIDLESEQGRDVLGINIPLPSKSCVRRNMPHTDTATEAGGGASEAELDGGAKARPSEEEAGSTAR